jgi:ribonuclease P protein component
VEPRQDLSCGVVPAGRWIDAHGHHYSSDGSSAGRLGQEAVGEANFSTEQSQAGQETRVPPPHVDSRRAGDPSGSPPKGPSSAVGLIWKVRGKAAFAALRIGRRVRCGPLTVSFVEGNPAEPPRVAYAIGRRVGGAVERNLLRRRLRAVVGQLSPQLRPGTYLIGAAPEAARLSVGELRAIVIRTLEAIGQSKPQRDSGRTPPGGSAA